MRPLRAVLLSNEFGRRAKEMHLSPPADKAGSRPCIVREQQRRGIASTVEALRIDAETVSESREGLVQRKTTLTVHCRKLHKQIVHAPRIPKRTSHHFASARYFILRAFLPPPALPTLKAKPGAAFSKPNAQYRLVHASPPPNMHAQKASWGAGTAQAPLKQSMYDYHNHNPCQAIAASLPHPFHLILSRAPSSILFSPFILGATSSALVHHNHSQGWPTSNHRPSQWLLETFHG